jgi:hypothetical protein
MDKLGDNFPKELIEKSIFIKGGVFLKKKHQFRSELPKPRIFFVLNTQPQNDDRIITVHATTKIESRKKVRISEVLVEIKPDEYEELKDFSIVDCESFIVWRKIELQKCIKSGDIIPLKTVSENLLNKLRVAIANSKTLATIDKRLIIPEDE